MASAAVEALSRPARKCVVNLLTPIDLIVPCCKSCVLCYYRLAVFSFVSIAPKADKDFRGCLCDWPMAGTELSSLII